MRAGELLHAREEYAGVPTLPGLRSQRATGEVSRELVGYALTPVPKSLTHRKATLATVRQKESWALYRFVLEPVCSSSRGQR